MCNCNGHIAFSNCAGNSECNCNKTSNFNNAVGVNGFSNLSGEIQTLSTPSINVSTSIPQVQVKTTVPTTAPTTQPSTLNKVLDLGTSALGMFGKKTSTDVAPSPLPEEEPAIPMTVWLVAGGLLLLLIVFFIVKASKK